MLKALLFDFDLDLRSCISLYPPRGLSVADEKDGGEYTVSSGLVSSDETLNPDYGKLPVNYMSLDGRGINLRDPSYKFYEKGDFTGFISYNYSDAQCVHGGALVITTPSYQATPGLTIFFWQDYPYQITVKYYKDSELLSETVYYPDNIIYYCEKAVRNWNEVEIVFDYTRYPLSYIKLYNIEFGKAVVADKFAEFNMLEEINILSDDLSVNTADFTVYTPEPLASRDKYDLQITKENKIYGFYDVGDVEQVDKNKYTVQGNDIISVLERASYDGTEMYNGIETMDFSFEDLIGIISYYTETDIEIDSYFNGYQIHGWLPKCTYRQALVQACWAVGGIIDSSRSDKITIKPIPTNISSVIMTADKRIIGDAVFKKSDVKSNAVWSRKIFSEQPTAEEKELFSLDLNSNTIEANNIKYFDKPTRVLRVSPLNTPYIATPGWCYIIPPTEGVYTCYGYEYTESSIDTEIQNTDIKSTVSGKTERFDKFTLYGKDALGNTDFKATQIKRYISSRGTVTARIVLKNEKVGDLITIETAFSGLITGIIISMNLSLTYSNVADIEVFEWNTGIQ